MRLTQSFLYNAFFYIQPQWSMIEKEWKRVVKETGEIWIIGTWRLNANLIISAFGENTVWHDGFLIVKVKK